MRGNDFNTKLTILIITGPALEIYIDDIDQMTASTYE